MLLNIAGIRLSLAKETASSLSENFKKFLETKKRPDRDIWQLECKGPHEIKPSGRIINAVIRKKYIQRKRIFFHKFLKKERLNRKMTLAGFDISGQEPVPNLSIYFNVPLSIYARKKKIILLEEGAAGSDILNSMFLSYIYSQALALKSGLLLHAASVIQNKKAYLFFAPSGGGKSTVASLSRKHRVAADDVAAIRKIGQDFFSFFTPWHQSHFVKPDKKNKARVKALFFLKKSKEISFRPIGQEEALVRILSSYIHFLIFTEPPLAKKIFRTAASLARVAPAYEMSFARNKDFWPKLERAVKNRILIEEA
jgi:hypothetical protein